MSFRLNLPPARRPLAAAVAVALGLPGFASSAFGQGMEEIVTTARGRAETLKDVPAAVTVIGADTIDQKGIRRVEDFVNLTPGMSIVNTAEVADTQVNIRGINGARDGEINYALIVDGILINNPAGLNREWANLEQIEVLKGPQGALYGRNAAAGAIIMTTKLPEEDFEGAITGSAGEDDTYFVNGRLGGVTADERLTWQVIANYRDSDGYFSDVFQNADDVVDYFENWNVQGRMIFDVTSNWTLDTKLRYGEVEAGSIVFNSVFHIPFVAQLFNAPAFAENVNERIDNVQFNTNITSFNEQEALEFSIKSDTDLGWADLSAWLLYSDIENNLGADGTSGAFGFFWGEQNCIQSTQNLAGFPLAPPQFLSGDPTTSVFGAYTPTTCDGTQYQERNQEDVSFEVRLRSKDDQRVRWEAGVYYLNIEREVGVNLGIDTGAGLIPELYTTNPLNPTEQLVWDRFDTDVYAVFGQLAWDLSDSVELSFAARYDREEREVTNLVPTPAQGAVTDFIVYTPGAPFTGGDPINPGLFLDPTGASGDAEETFNQFQPKVALSWDATDQLTVFASAGVGFKSGGFNNFGSAATVDLLINQNPNVVAQPGFDPVAIEDRFDEETSTALEVGFKSGIGDRFEWEGAAYFIDVDDMQFFEFFVGQFGLLRVVSNIDEVSIKGLELSATWSPTDWLDLYANGNVIDSEIDQNTSRPDTVGNESPYTPEYTFAVGGNVRVPITSSLDFIANLGINGVGETWFHVVQDQQRPTIFGAPGSYELARRDSYELVDLRVGIAGENWQVVAWGTNVFDEAWLNEVIPAPEFGGSFISPGALDRFGIEATYRF